MRVSPPVLFAMMVPLLTALGCGGTPSGANIALRKTLQQRDNQIATMNKQHNGDVADLRAAGRPTTATVSPDELARLFTTHGLSFGRLTGGSNLDTGKPGDQGLKIYVVPSDDDGQPLKAAGTFEVEAFDLSEPDNLIGKWQFDLAATRRSWYGGALLYNYVLVCPWQKRVPAHSQLTLRVTFHDELTDREFTQQRVVSVNAPPSTAIPSRP